jgi:hypothetical protein
MSFVKRWVRMVDIKREEEIKRDRHWDPRDRWRLIQEAITWAEAQVTTGKRNEPQSCLREQERKLRGSQAG